MEGDSLVSAAMDHAVLPLLESMHKFTIRQLEYFVAAGRCGNLTQAARLLHVSQPAITNAIAQLEGAFGQPLFQRRHGEGVTLTAAGRQAIREARNLLTLIEDFPSALRSSVESPRGIVHLGCFEPFACYHLPRLLGALTRDLPEITVEFSLMTQKELHDALQIGQIELALSYDSGFWEDLDKRILFRVSPYAMVCAGHRLAELDAISLRDLCAEPFVLTDLPESREYQLSVMRSFGAEPRVRYYCSNLEVLRGLVAHGLGVSLSVTRPVGDQSYDGQAIAYRPLREEVPQQAVVLAHARHVRLTHAAQAVTLEIDRYFAGSAAGSQRGDGGRAVLARIGRAP
jgi:DNA-binding transcriptional LysR family regulator